MNTAFSSGVGAIAVTVLVTAAAAARGLWSPCGLSMISALNPFTERSRGHRFAGTALWFVIGSVLGGALLGAVGAVGALAMSSVAVAPVATGGLAEQFHRLCTSFDRVEPSLTLQGIRMAHEHLTGGLERG